MRNILLCVKQVPKDNKVRTDPVRKTILRTSGEAVLNRDDRYALDLAVRLKNSTGAHLAVMTMGPAQAADVLKECLSLGADEAILITDRVFAGSDTYGTSAVLAAAARLTGPYDLVLCGQEASDGNTAQVGPQLAQRLGLALISGTLSADIAGQILQAVRRTDDGKETVQTDLPALLTVLSSGEELPMPDLRSVIAASHAQIRAVRAADLPEQDLREAGLAGALTQVLETYTPAEGRKAMLLNGSDPAGAASELTGILFGKGLLKEADGR